VSAWDPPVLSTTPPTFLLRLHPLTRSTPPFLRSFIIATNSSDFREQPLLLNLVSLLAVLIAKMPQMHTVRIFGINK